MLELRDLDFNPHDTKDMERRELAESLNDIRTTRSKLGAMTLRDSMEAIYGTAYTLQVLGEDTGDDILIDEMTALDDLREAAGLDRNDVGGNRLPAGKPADADREALSEALADQVEYTEQMTAEGAERWMRHQLGSFNKVDPSKSTNAPYTEDITEVRRLYNTKRES